MATRYTFWGIILQRVAFLGNVMKRDFSTSLEMNKTKKRRILMRLFFWLPS